MLADGRTVITVSVGEKVALAARVTALGTATDTTMPGVADGSVPRLATLISRIAWYRPLRRLLRETGELLEALVGTDVGDLDAAIAELEALHPGVLRAADAAVRHHDRPHAAAWVAGAERDARSGQMR